MMFRQIHGNAPVVQALSGMVDSGRIPHAIMFHEDDGGGAFALTTAFLQYLYCRSRDGGDSCGACPSCNKTGKLIHPDIHYVFPTTSQLTSDHYIGAFRELALSNPTFTEEDMSHALGIEGKSTLIAVAEAKSIMDKLSLSALEGGYRSVVVYLPEKMNQEAANRLLKLIEEPPALTQFILITHNPEKVLQTILSRCQRIRVLPESHNSATVTGDDSMEELFSRIMDAVLSRNLPAALEAGESAAALPSRECAGRFCAYASESMRRVFLIQQGLEELCPAGCVESIWAARCGKAFPRKSLEAINRANLLIGRNVNLKILFTDLVNQIYKVL